MSLTLLFRKKSLNTPGWAEDGCCVGSCTLPVTPSPVLAHLTPPSRWLCVFHGDYQHHHQTKHHPGTGVQPLWMPAGLHPPIALQDFPHCIWNQFGLLWAECRLLPQVTQEETFCFLGPKEVPKLDCICSGGRVPCSANHSAPHAPKEKMFTWYGHG